MPTSSRSWAGSEYHLGWIVGIGTVGSLVTRLLLGAWIDRYGTRPLWIASALLFAATCFAHLAVASHTGVAIYLLRISYCCAVAGANGASMTFISKCGPKERLAELVGMLGTAGFVGAVVGTLLGDLLLGSLTLARGQVMMMFVIAGGVRARLAAAGLGRHAQEGKGTRARQRQLLDVFAPAATQSGHGAWSWAWRWAWPWVSDHVPPHARHRPGHPADRPVLHGLRHGCDHHARPDPPLVRAVRPAADHLAGHGGHGREPALLLPVGQEWQIDAAGRFVRLLARGSLPLGRGCRQRSFPLANRGFATILILATWDLGRLIGSPAAGAVIRYAPLAHLTPYPTLFIAMAALMAIVGGWYALPAAAKLRSAAKPH